MIAADCKSFIEFVLLLLLKHKKFDRIVWRCWMDGVNSKMPMRIECSPKHNPTASSRSCLLLFVIETARNTEKCDEASVKELTAAIFCMRLETHK